MERTTLKFNGNKLEYAFRFNTPDFAIKILNVYVHSPSESSFNKQSIEWTLKLKPFLKLTFKSGSEAVVKRIDISFLNGIYEGRPISWTSNTPENSTEISRDMIQPGQGIMELEYDKQYSAPEISVDFELSAGVEKVEDMSVVI